MEKLNIHTKKLITTFIYILLVPTIICMGIFLWNGQHYNILSLCIVVLCCIPFFVNLEKRPTTARELSIVAVMTTISVIGRLIFAPIPGFKPVTAIVIITALSLGSRAGYMTGLMSAIVSNIFFGQGPWTPIQMFVWGFLGFVAGLLCNYKWARKPLPLIVLGGLGGISFSLLMDIWTLFNQGNISWESYLAIITTSLPFIAIYMISNIIFLIILTQPLTQKLDRIKFKFDIFK